MMNESIINKLALFSEVLGWTLIHSLWQIGLVAIVLQIVLHFVPQRNALVRYNLSLFSLLVIAVWTAVTFGQQLQGVDFTSNASSEGVLIALPTLDAPTIPQAMDMDVLISMFAAQLNDYLPLLSSVWLLGITFLLVRLLLNYKQLHRLDQQHVQLPSTEWLDQLNHFCERLGITRKVKLLLSERISEPITFRHFRPVVLMPVSMMTGLSAAQIETLLLHELAHIRRHDYIINLFQSVLEILFFFHPAVWWISRIVREEREHCCDDLVLQHQQHPMLYAEALLQIQANHYSLKTNLAMSAKGNHKPFTTRIQRLFGKYPTPNSIARGTLAVLLVLGVLSVLAFSLPSEKVDLKKRMEATTSSDTLPERVAVVVNLDNEQAREVSLVVDRSVAETQDVVLLLEENGIEVEDSDITQVNIYGIEDVEDHPNTIGKRVQDMEDLFDDEVVNLVEVLKDGVEGVDTFITFELKERPITMRPILLEEPIEQGIRPKKGEVVFESIGLHKDTVGEPEQVKISLYGDKKLTDEEPLTIVDGEERTDLHKIDPKKIESITVYKGENALKKYGEKGQNGVVEVITKAKKSTGEKEDKTALMFDPALKVKITGTGNAKTKEAPLMVVDGQERENIEGIDPNDIALINVVKGKEATDKYGEKGRNGVVEVVTKGNRDADKEVNKSRVIIKGNAERTDIEPLFVIDGEISDRSTDLDPKDIETVRVLKGKDATDKYGEKGKNGVVEITMKKEQRSKKKSERDGYEKKIVVTEGKAKLSEDELVILNGEEYFGGLSSIDPETIISVSLLEGKSALQKYGEKGKYGVVEVRTRKGQSKNKKHRRIFVESNSYLRDPYPSAVTVRANKPLIILDGKEYNDAIHTITDNIENVNVLKDEKAIEKYGEKGKNGVVEITTKKGTRKANLANDTFKVFPNPSDDIVRIQGELKQDTRIQIEIWDAKGALIKQLINGTFKGNLGTKWDASNATPGTYIVKITMDGEVSSKKVVIK